MVTKNYKIGLIDFHYNVQHRKWNFVHSGVSLNLIANCRGGQITAHKAAKQINGAFNRSGQIDGLCRANLRKIGVG